MYKSKHNTVECALAFIIIPDTIIIAFGIVFALIALITNQFNLTIIPWIVYVGVGAFLLSTHLAYLIFYLCRRQILRFNSDEIIIFDGKKETHILKSQIQKIIYIKRSIFLAAISYESYGSVVIRCNEKANYVKVQFKSFPHVMKCMKKLGYPVSYEK